MPLQLPTPPLVLCLACAVTALACGSVTPTPRLATADRDPNVSPLGPSYVLIPLPSDDDALLGRILHELPDPGRSIEEISRPNPCAEHLSDVKVMPIANKYEDAQELSFGASASAMLGTFGFAGDAKRASYFVYKINTEKRAARADTNEYVQCCQQNDCGYGFVSSLVYGDGEYATAEESAAKGGATIGVASAEGQLDLKVLNRRNVRGWLAALVTVTDKSKAAQFGALGIAKQAGVEEESMSDQVKAIYDNNKVVVAGAGNNYVFRMGSGDALTENEFVRNYRSVTGSDELDDIEKRRNMGTVAVWGGLTAVGAAVFAFGTTKTQRSCSEDDVTNIGMEEPCQVPAGTPGAKEGFFSNTWYDPNQKTDSALGPVLMGVGGAMTVGFAIPLVIALLDPDGDERSHYLTDADARVYVGRYNRAFLRKIVRDVNQVSQGPTLRMRPFVGQGGPAGLGFFGTF